MGFPQTICLLDLTKLEYQQKSRTPSIRLASLRYPGLEGVVRMSKYAFSYYNDIRVFEPVFSKCLISKNVNPNNLSN